MSFFDHIFNKLFSGIRGNISSVLHKEVLQRKGRYETDYENWVNSGQASRILNSIKRSYFLTKQELEAEEEIYLLQSIYANGFALRCQSILNGIEADFMLDYFKSKILPLGYRMANSDSTLREKNNAIETTNKYYLKPDITIKEGELINQLFGNITLELIKVNDKPSLLKLQASIYSDSYYSKALDFEELIRHLFDFEE